MEAIALEYENTPDKLTRPITIREIVLSKTGLTLEEYVQKHPYDMSDYIEFNRAGIE